MEEANIVIIGAGIVGLAIAARLSENNRDVFVLERNSAIGLESSSRNSGVIHSGIHYPKGTLKAQLCTRGNRSLYRICETYKIPCKRLGKITVAKGEEEIKELEKLRRNGDNNGVEGMVLLDSDDIRKMERNVRADLALYTPTTGIVEQNELMNYFYARTINNGGYVSLKTEVQGIKKSPKGYRVDGKSAGSDFSIEARTIINTAGLNSDMIAAMAGIDIDARGYRLSYYKGDYFRISGEPPVRMLVYPVPHGAGLGIHLTPDISGSVRAGPNAYPVTSINYRVESREEDFRASIRNYLPSIDMYEMHEDSSGIRPKLSGWEMSFRDFIIKHEDDIGLTGLINLIGIESPGLTAAPAIADYVMEIYENEIK